MEFFKYQIEAYNDSHGMGHTNKIVVTVQATDEASALRRARAIVGREHYAVVGIEDLEARVSSTFVKNNEDAPEDEAPKKNGFFRRG